MINAFFKAIVLGTQAACLLALRICFFPKTSRQAACVPSTLRRRKKSSMPDSRTANEQLAEIVAIALVETGLVSSSRIEELKGKLASGTASPEDWSHWIAECGMQRKEPGGEQ